MGQQLLEQLFAEGGFVDPDDASQQLLNLEGVASGPINAAAIAAVVAQHQADSQSQSSPEVILRLDRMTTRRNNVDIAAIDPSLRPAAAGGLTADAATANLRSGRGDIRIGHDNVLYRATDDQPAKRYLNQRTADAHQIDWDSQDMIGPRSPTPGPSGGNNQQATQRQKDIPTGYDGPSADPDHDINQYINDNDWEQPSPGQLALSAPARAATPVWGPVASTSNQPQPQLPPVLLTREATPVWDPVQSTSPQPAVLTRARENFARAINNRRGGPPATQLPARVVRPIAGAPPSQRPGHSSFTAMLVADDGRRGAKADNRPQKRPYTARGTANQNDEDAFPPPRPTKRVAREPSSGGFEDDETDDTDAERARAKATRPAAAAVNQRRFNRDVAVHQGSVLRPNGPTQASNDSDEEEGEPVASARRDRRIVGGGRAYADPDKYRSANQDHWTPPQEALLIQEVEMFFERHDCMAHIVSRHGQNGTISNEFGSRSSVQLKDKAVNVSSVVFARLTSFVDGADAGVS